MRRFLVLVLGMLLLFGCLAAPQEQTNNPQPSVPNTTPPAGNTNQSNPPPSCSEYCMSQPHVQCVGAWNISGAYPDCVCGFACETNASNPQTNNTQGGNNNTQTANSSQTNNASEPASPPPGYTTIPTDRSVSQMIDDELARIKDDFYSTHDGSFTENSYRWERIVPLGDSLSTAPASDVKFGDQAINSIEASAFIVFQNNADNSRDTYGVAIFRARQTPLDNYSPNDMFDIYYFPQMINKHLRDCWTDTRDYNIDEKGDWLITYRFQC